MALKDAVKQLMLNTTLHGCRHLAEDGRHWMERMIWTLVQVTAMWGVATSVTDVYWEYMSTPTVTSLATTQYPGWNVPFPAIGFCNVNKISKVKALELTEELSLLDHTRHPSDEMFELIHTLGHIYDAEPSGYKKLLELHQVLSSYNVSIHNILIRLAPSCSSMLRRCRWKGSSRNCDELFSLTATINGFCCVFNVLPDGQGKGEDEPIAESLQTTGHRSGLTVTVDPQPEDYYYPVVPTYGVQVMIFSPLNRPENSNGMIEYLAERGRELFYSINSFSQYSAAELGTFDPLERGCLFRTETTSRYTSTNCLAACMRHLILDSCRCLPYYVKNSSNSKLCDLADVPCLARSKVKFHQYLHQEEGKLAADDSPCGQCLPACSNTWYDVQSSFAKFTSQEPSTSFSLLDGTEVSRNMSVVHLYYNTLDTTLYKQDVIYTRTELVSNFGGICSLYNGFSFISLAEILYFLTIRLFYIIRKEQQTQRDLEEVDQIPTLTFEPSPYWNEIRVNQTVAADEVFTLRKQIAREKIWDY